ncbi:MAG: translation initiation factor IF-6 [Candidatus Micrarchaeota archaeon]|nr:translation initiation factor IF-6 [Candidatus Micrarchaeota archaeon]
MRIVKASFEKNPFIGLFIRASERIVLVPRNAPKKLVDAAAETLGAEVVRLFVNQSYLLGLYTAMNSTGCVLPDFAEKEDIAILKKAGFNVALISSRFAAVGNNVLANDKGALANPELSKKDCGAISDCLGVKVSQFKVGGHSTVGSLNVVTNSGIFAYSEASEHELKRMEECFGVGATRGSANMGVPFNSLSVVANSKGAVVGELTSGFEITRVYEAFA